MIGRDAVIDQVIACAYVSMSSLNLTRSPVSTLAAFIMKHFQLKKRQAIFTWEFESHIVTDSKF